MPVQPLALASSRKVFLSLISATRLEFGRKDHDRYTIDSFISFLFIPAVIDLCSSSSGSTIQHLLIMAEKLIVGPGNPAQRGEDLARVVLIACATSAMNSNRTKRRTSSGETFESLIERAPAHGDVEKNNEAPKEGVRVVLKKQGGKYWIFCLRGPAEQAREDHKHREEKRVPPLKELRVILGDVVEEVQIFHGNNATPNRPSKAMLRYAYTL
eukprot:5543-Heterococcus_DN1.PRE.1